MFKHIYPDHKTIPDGTEFVTANVIIEESLATMWLEEIGDTPWDIIVKDASEYWFDIGGSMGMDEPTLEHTVNGLDISVLLRHAEVLQKRCRDTQTCLDYLGEHIYLPGRWISAVLTIDTGNKIGDWIDDALESRIGESDQLWSAHQDKLKSAGVCVVKPEGA